MESSIKNNGTLWKAKKHLWQGNRNRDLLQKVDVGGRNLWRLKPKTVFGGNGLLMVYVLPWTEKAQVKVLI